MAYAFLSAGSVVIGNANAALTPVAPTVATGSLLLLQSQCYEGGAATPTVTGWTKLSPGVNANQIAQWGRISTGTDPASVNWAETGGVNASAYIVAYSGAPATLTGIVHASSDNLNNNNEVIVFPSLTITQPNCLVINGGARDKTSASDAGTWGTLTGFTPRVSSIPSGTNIASIFNDWIQTSATNVSSLTQTMGVADGSTQQFETYIVALLPGTGGGGGGGGSHNTLATLGYGS